MALKNLEKIETARDELAKLLSDAGYTDEAQEITDTVQNVLDAEEEEDPDEED